LNYSNYRSSQPQQLSLFEPSANYQLEKKQAPVDFVMSKSFLEQWKKRIYSYQQEQIFNQGQQTNLINDNNKISEVESFDPFSLKTHTDQFYDLPDYSLSESCLYFILDTHYSLLLYVGETKRSPGQRWINHDCKSYIQRYIELHRQYNLPVLIRSAFWWSVPEARKVRQQLEKELILKWRSPFNKESWQWWGQPFKSS
jgi:hypothetical protein